VPHKLVAKTQRFLRNDLVALDDDRAVQAAAFDLAQLDELLDVLVDGEGPGGGDLGDVDVRIDGQRQVLGVNATVVGRRAGDFQAMREELLRVTETG
jgi:hypothetical protein